MKKVQISTRRQWDHVSHHGRFSVMVGKFADKKIVKDEGGGRGGYGNTIDSGRLRELL